MENKNRKTMAIEKRGVLKNHFKTGCYPTEKQFSNVLDSFVHKNDEISMGMVAGLNDVLNSKADRADSFLTSAQSAAEQSAALAAAFESRGADVIAVAYWDDSDEAMEIFGDQDIMSGSAQRWSATEIRLQLVCSHGAAQVTYTLADGAWTAEVASRRFDAVATQLADGLMSAADKARLDGLDDRLRYVSRDAAKLRMGNGVNTVGYIGNDKEGQDDTTLNVKATDKLSVKATGRADISAGGKIKLTAGDDVEIEGNDLKLTSKYTGTGSEAVNGKVRLMQTYIDKNDDTEKEAEVRLDCGNMKTVGTRQVELLSDGASLTLSSNKASLTDGRDGISWNTQNGDLNINRTAVAGKGVKIKGNKIHLTIGADAHALEAESGRTKLRSPEGNSSVTLAEDDFRVVFPPGGDIQFIESGSQAALTTLRSLMAAIAEQQEVAARALNDLNARLSAVERNLGI